MSQIKDIFTGWKNLLTGKETPTQKSRLKKCAACPELRGATKTCNKCGCYMPAKVTLPDAKCPLNKW